MTLIIGADRHGLRLKRAVLHALQEKKIDCHDHGQFEGERIDYPDIAAAVATRVACSEFSKGILICKTGIGMAIVANKFRGVRAAVCHDLLSAEMSVKSNNAQILVFGAAIVSNSHAIEILNVWLTQADISEDSKRHLAKITALEDRTMRQYSQRAPALVE